MMTENTRLAKPKAIFLMGPTAAGKTGLAVDLVQRFPVEIISVDSALVYKDMAIGTAKPDEDTLLHAPHRLIDFIDPSEAYSAARFRKDALREMDAIVAAGRIPLLVGGTFLYFKALEKGLSPLPKASPKVRAEIQMQADQLGWQALHQQLGDIDPEAAARIHPNDPQRLQRALEVYTLTGKSLTQWQKETEYFDFPYDLIKLALMPRDRAWLHERIEQRFLLMMEQGFVAEVKRLYRRDDLNLNLPAIRAVGYRQIWEHIQGKLSYNEMLRRGIVATRQLAKRQLTWLRSEENIERIEIPMRGINDEKNAVFKKIEDFLCQKRHNSDE